MAAIALNGSVLLHATPAAAALARQEHTGPVSRPPLTARVALVLVTTWILVLGLSWVAVRATKPLIVRSARIRQFRSELRDLDTVALSWDDGASPRKGWPVNGRRPVVRGDDDSK